MAFGRAINRGLHRALTDDPKVLLMGEDIGALGGVFRITDGLLEEFGPERVVDTPLAESGIVGTAVELNTVQSPKNSAQPWQSITWK